MLDDPPRFDHHATLSLIDSPNFTAGQVRLLTAMVASTDSATGQVRASQALLADRAKLSRQRVNVMLKDLAHLFSEQRVRRQRNLSWMLCPHGIPVSLCKGEATIQDLKVTHHAEATEQKATPSLRVLPRALPTLKKSFTDGVAFDSPNSSLSQLSETEPFLCRKDEIELSLASRPERDESQQPTRLQQRGLSDEASLPPPHQSMTAMEKVVDRLTRVRHNGTTTLASCPVASHGKGHGDHNPSLSIKDEGGKVLINCMAGCHTQDVLIAIGLDWPDLFDEPITHDRGIKVAEWTYQAKDGSPYLVVERFQTSNGKDYKQHKPGQPTMGDAKPILYRLPDVLAAAKAHQEVWLCEGEKCCSALSRLGVLATTGPGGVKGAWRDYYVQWLQGCSMINIVADNDEPGLAYAAKVEAALRGAEIPVRTWAVAVPFPKADIYDHVVAGYGLADLKPIKLNQRRPKTIHDRDLTKMIFPEKTWVIDGILPTGLALLSGPPKIGKSSVMLDIALSVASGGLALSFWPTMQGSVLYLSLDNDSEARLRARRDAMCNARRIERDLPIEYAVDWNTGQEALEGIREWVLDERETGRRPLLVVADTLGHLDPDYEGDGKRSAYLAAVSSLKKWARLATDLDIALVAVHHSRKMADTDWVNSSFTGTNGTTASAHTLLALQAKRGETDGRLAVTGRDVPTSDYKLRSIGGWRWVSDEAPASSYIYGVPR